VKQLIDFACGILQYSKKWKPIHKIDVLG
jgi:hypothetical protein